MALIISLILLLLLTLISVSAMKTSSLEERMAGNDRDRNMAFQEAEAALRAGEARIIQLWRNQAVPVPLLPPDDPSNGTGSIQQFCNGAPGGIPPVDGIGGVFHAVATNNTATTVKDKTSLVEPCGVCIVDCPVPDENDVSIWSDNNKTVEVDTDGDPLTSTSRYFITYIYFWHSENANANEMPIYKFTVTARGVGKSDKSVVMLRSYFGGATGFED
jgi:Tfp pilus assembly protein PilX